MTDHTLHYFNISAFQNHLLDWYYENKRELPWRENQDPYRVWVSEIMLQQTKVDTVIPYFHRFMEKFPTPTALAEADSQDVLKTWEGLGYYSRAKNLQNAVREVVSHYGGEVPSNPKELGSLKGVGPYTKGAILSIAYNQPEPAVDGNVMRVFSRVLKIEEDISKARTKKLFESQVREFISEEDPGGFNQAIMDLGATICTPTSPACLFCPVQEHCIAFAEGLEEALPVKKKAKKQKPVAYLVLLIKDEQDRYVIEKRPDEGLLANLWQFLMVPIEEVGWDHAANWVHDEYGLDIKISKRKGELKHVFSHLIWEMEIYEARISGLDELDGRLRAVSKEEAAQFPFPVSHQKMFTYME
ncbi:A/G-specific adenine glycosylase [Lentibacillus sediminis]|uniref:A/G-specific adenine glycosylase n=1 Tax=Lentibacillus sediminis TaxID=1940529 RepID=UPI000C1C1EE4|nr:A/G-specific adenine glycosylase [Lentibacillus sediminis]